MDKEKYELFTNIHNELIDRLGIEPDKYERQDSFSAIIDIQGGRDMKDALVSAFDLVYDTEIPDSLYEEVFNKYKAKPIIRLFRDEFYDDVWVTYCNILGIDEFTARELYSVELEISRVLQQIK